MLDTLIDTLLDTLKLIPFLFLTYLLMEFVEHKTSEKAGNIIRRAGKFGPLLGGIMGMVPQCGFSASAAGLYSGGLISLGTMVAIFLSTSDEMLPIFLSEQVEASLIGKVLLTKVIIAVIFGFAVDIALKLAKKSKKEIEIHSICEHDHCHCEEGGIFKSAVHHSLHIIIFIFLVSLVLNFVIYFIGEENIGKLFVDVPVLGCAISCLVGLIPNCAASVVITELYLEGIISSAALISGLLTGCGIGILVLFRTNKNVKENIGITVLMYFLGLVAGIVAEISGITF